MHAGTRRSQTGCLEGWVGSRAHACPTVGAAGGVCRHPSQAAPPALPRAFTCSCPFGPPSGLRCVWGWTGWPRRWAGGRCWLFGLYLSVTPKPLWPVPVGHRQTTGALRCGRPACPVGIRGAARPLPKRCGVPIRGASSPGGCVHSTDANRPSDHSHRSTRQPKDPAGRLPLGFTGRSSAQNLTGSLSVGLPEVQPPSVHPPCPRGRWSDVLDCLS